MKSPYLGAMACHELVIDTGKRAGQWRDLEYPVAVEGKLDGFRITHVDGNGYTRNGNTYETTKPFAEILAGLVPATGGLHVDTEMIARNWNDTSSLLKRLKKIDHERIKAEVTAHVFDAFDATSLGKEIYTQRREAVRYLVNRANELGTGYRFAVSEMLIARDRAEVETAFDYFLGLGLEGIIVKTLNGLYTLEGRDFRSYAWLKRKPFKDITVTVTGVESGHGLCTSCMTVDRREQRAAAHNYQAFDTTSPIYGQTIDRDDVKPDPACPTCAGAATGIARPDVLGSLLTVLADGRPLKVGMGITEADKIEWMKNPPIGRKCDVKIQVDPGQNEIVARHASWMRWRDDI